MADWASMPRRIQLITLRSVAQQNRGSHGAERAMARGDGVSVGLNEAEESVGDAGLRGEVVHFVVEEKSGGGGDVRAVAVVQGVGAGDGVSFGVDDGKMGGVRAFAEADDSLRRAGSRGRAAGM